MAKILKEKTAVSTLPIVEAKSDKKAETNLSVVKAQLADNSEIKNDKTVDLKEEVKVEKKKPNRFFLKAFLFLFFSFLLIGGGVVLGAYSYPYAYNWLVDHSFISIDEEGNSKIDLNSGNSVAIKSTEEAIIDVVKNSRESVVSIAISKVYLGEEGVVDQNSNIGSGFIVDPSGIIITNQHVVSDQNAQFRVVTTDGREFDVLQVIRDDYNDIAILKVDGKDLKALPLGNSDELNLGQSVIAIGTPLGEFAGSVTTGVISGLNRSVTTGQSGFWGISKVYENVIQTDAAVNPGNSGGPLLNLKGEVIGINFATTASASNISFALPINILKQKLDEFRVYGKIIKPYLGVQYQMISEAEARLYKNVVAGALIARVSPDSPSYKAGIQKGDIITEFGGDKVNVSLSALIQKHKVGEEIEVKIRRGDQDVVLKVTLSESAE